MADETSLTLSSPTTSLKGIGPQFQNKLDKLGLFTLGDLVHHYPRRYLDYSKRQKITSIKEGDNVSLFVKVGEPRRFKARTGRLITTIKAFDDTGKINLVWFNNPYISRLIEASGSYVVAGKVSSFNNQLTLVSPQMETLDGQGLHTTGLVPIYPQTEGLTSKWLRQKIRSLLDNIKIKDPISELAEIQGLVSQDQAYENIHFPKNQEAQNAADQRLAFNYHLYQCLKNHDEIQNLAASVAINPSHELHHHLLKKLPFTLTPAQKKAIQESYIDLNSGQFTHRLIQGETGSGKTAVIFFIAQQTLQERSSFCLLAPTEILAEQHAQTFANLQGSVHNIFLVTGKHPLRSIPKTPAIFIGTTALLNQLPNHLDSPLAVLAVDEQHKFGVKDRESLLQRSPVPHLFNLTATPIPRTVALGLFGEIKISNIKSKPTNRLPVKTFVVNQSKFDHSTDWLNNILKNQGKIFVVCPQIGTSVKQSEVANAEKIFQRYQGIFKNAAWVGLIHGQMKSELINSTLNQFRTPGGKILVSTTIIEVGIDIPEAQVIIIHSAERFGLAQLHQLRGRVGRNGDQGYCFLIPTSDDQIEISRLQLLSKHNSGLTLSKLDLRLRGAGEIWGDRQHGWLPVRLKSFWDKKLYSKAKHAALHLAQIHPDSIAEVVNELNSC